MCLIEHASPREEVIRRKADPGPGWERRNYLEAEGWSRLALAEYKSEPWAEVSPFCLNKGSDHRLTKDPPKPKIGSSVYHHLEDWAVSPNAWALLDTAFPKAPGKPSCLPGLSVHICEMAFHSAAPNPLGALLSTWVQSQALPEPSRLYLIWIHFSHSALHPVAFIWASDKLLPLKTCAQAAQAPRTPFLNPISMYASSLRVWNKFPCMSHHLGSETSLLHFSLLIFYSLPSVYLSQVVIIYSVIWLLHLFRQPKMCGAPALWQAITNLKHGEFTGDCREGACTPGPWYLEGKAGRHALSP